jgi:flagellar protein FlgJ
MSSPPVNVSYYADFGRMEALKRTARQDQPAAVREAARQFESLFTHMLLKSMREANLGEGMGDSEQTQFYQDMFDQQLSVQMSQGKGLGLAERLVQQLQRTGLTAPQSLAPADAPAAVPAAAPAAPVAVGGVTTEPPSASNTRAQFIKNIWPYAEQAARRIGVAIESVVAHAALETGWGRHLPTGASDSGNNLFGIKAGSSWQGASAVATTTEFAGRDTTSVRAPFRSYASVATGMSDYADLLTSNPRYASALNQGSDARAFAQGLQRGGYATDPSYVHKLVSTAAAVRDLAAHSALKNSAALPTTPGAGTA